MSSEKGHRGRRHLILDQFVADDVLHPAMAEQYRECFEGLRARGWTAPHSADEIQIMRHAFLLLMMPSRPDARQAYHRAVWMAREAAVTGRKVTADKWGVSLSVIDRAVEEHEATVAAETGRWTRKMFDAARTQYGLAEASLPNPKSPRRKKVRHQIASSVTMTP